MNKIIMEFEEPFWSPDEYGFTLTSDIRGEFPFFYNFSKIKKRNILVCFLTDDFARETEKTQNDLEIV